MKTAIIKAVKIDNQYQMQAILPDTNQIELPEEGILHHSAQSVYRDAAAMYPATSTWQGRKVNNGYRIVID